MTARTGIVRKVDILGRLVIPKETRTLLGIDDNNTLEFFTDEDQIIIKKYAPGCIFCQSDEGLTVFKNKQVCKTCIQEI